MKNSIRHERISEFMHVTMGQSPPSETYNQQRNGLPFFQGVTDFGDMFPIPRYWCNSPQKTANENELLFSVRAPVGEVNLTKEKCCIGRGIASLTPKDSDLRYCFYLLQEFKYKFSSHSQGTTFEAINRNDISNVMLPYIDNLKEQQKIASILSELDDLVHKIEQIIELSQRLKKGLMQRLFTKGIGHTKFKNSELGKIPTEWDVSTIGRECRVGTGGTPSRSRPDYYSGNIPWIKTGEINFSPITSSKEYITKAGLDNSAAKLYPKGTLLIAMYGEGVTRGRSAVLEIEAAVNQAAAAVQPLNSLVVYYLFYWCYLQYEKIRGMSHGPHQANLNLTFISSLKVPITTKVEQLQIVSILSVVDTYREKYYLLKSGLDTLKKGLRKKLLTGKIRVKV